MTGFTIAWATRSAQRPAHAERMRTSLRPWHWAALTLNLGLSAIALNDAVTHGLTGHNSAAAGTSGNSAVIVASVAVHGLAYLAIAFVLWREADAFRAANRFARGLRWTLLGVFGFMGLAMLAVETWRPPVSDGTQSPWAVWELIGTAVLLVMVVGSCLLGFALLRTNPLGVGGRILLGVLPTVALIFVLAAVAPDWSHPGYVESVVGVGMSLLGAGAAARSPLPRNAQRSTHASVGAPQT